MIRERRTIGHEGPQMRQGDSLAKRAEKAISAHLVKNNKQDIGT